MYNGSSPGENRTVNEAAVAILRALDIKEGTECQITVTVKDESSTEVKVVETLSEDSMPAQDGLEGHFVLFSEDDPE